MKKKLQCFCLILASIFLLGAFAACGGNDGYAKNFIDAVNAIGTITVESGDELDAAEELYNKLSADETMRTDVIKAYETLETYRARYESLRAAEKNAERFVLLANKIPDPVTLDSKGAIYAAQSAYKDLDEAALAVEGVSQAYEKVVAAQKEYDRLLAEKELENAKTQAAAYIALTQAVPSAGAVTRFDLALIERAEQAYQALGTLAKEQEGVSDAQAYVQAARDRYDYLIANPEEADRQEIAAFIAKVENLYDSAVTLESLDEIRSAEKSFRYLSAEAKKDETALSANEKLKAVRAKYDELYRMEQEEEAAAAFVEAVGTLPPVDELTLGHVTKADEISSLYEKLGERARAFKDVIAAKAVLDAALAKIDSFEREKIPVPNASSVGFSGDVMPFVLLWSIDYQPVADLYGVPVQRLGEKVDLVINIYRADAQDKADPFWQFTDNSLFTVEAGRRHIVYSDKITAALEEASVTVSDLRSGDSFKFSAWYRDKTGLFEDSDVTEISEPSPRGYEFTPAVQPDAEIYEIRTLQDLLAVKDHLNSTIELLADIDASTVENWHHLGKLNGVFNGNGHKIYNLRCDEATRSEEERKNDPRGTTIFALFETMSVTAVVKNLAVYGIVENAGSWAGAIVIDNNGGLISNCYIELDITAKGTSREDGGFNGDGYLGGVCVNNNGRIEFCIVNSVLKGTGSEYAASGMTPSGAFATGNSGTIENSFANGDRLTDQTGVANSGSHSELIFTEVELMDNELYHGWDTNIWNIENGYIPTLKIQKQERS